MDSRHDRDQPKDESRSTARPTRSPSVHYMLGLPMPHEAHVAYVDAMIATAERLLARELARAAAAAAQRRRLICKAQCSVTHAAFSELVTKPGQLGNFF